MENKSTQSTRRRGFAKAYTSKRVTVSGEIVRRVGFDHAYALESLRLVGAGLLAPNVQRLVRGGRTWLDKKGMQQAIIDQHLIDAEDSRMLLDSLQGVGYVDRIEYDGVAYIAISELAVQRMGSDKAIDPDEAAAMLTALVDKGYLDLSQAKGKFSATVCDELAAYLRPCGKLSS